MPKYDASSAEVLLFSFKDGLLAKVAHDLKMRVDDFSIDVADDLSSVKATFQANRISVLTAMKDGRDDYGTLSDGDKKKILANISDDVLNSRRHPTITFESSSVREQGSTRTVSGNLTLNGQTRSVSATIREEGANWVTDVTLQQPDFGIKPYKALGGALKVKPEVRVSVRVPKS
ncbi:MAG: YceI family protein [Sandaracinaceae bacterium]|nr:YceI family protein [Sandaracinaceae bacterium]